MDKPVVLTNGFCLLIIIIIALVVLLPLSKSFRLFLKLLYIDYIYRPFVYVFNKKYYYKYKVIKSRNYETLDIKKTPYRFRLTFKEFHDYYKLNPIRYKLYTNAIVCRIRVSTVSPVITRNIIHDFPQDFYVIGLENKKEFGLYWEYLFNMEKEEVIVKSSEELSKYLNGVVKSDIKAKREETIRYDGELSEIIGRLEKDQLEFSNYIQNHKLEK